jgi:hypothetical protein
MTLHQVTSAKQRGRIAAEAAPNNQPASGGCDVRFGAPVDLFPAEDPTTWAAVRQLAPKHTVADGTVMSTDVGFFAGIPATVVEVAPRAGRRSTCS